MVEAAPAASDVATIKADDRRWTLSLFGTAVGAGIMFLPIAAGNGGLWPLVILTLLVFPMTFIAHRGVARFCLTSADPEDDISDAVEEHFGQKAGVMVTIAYVAAIFPILMVYGISITNVMQATLVDQLGLTAPPRWLLSLICVGLMIGVMEAGNSVVLKVTEILVWPLIAILFGISLYLIPQWSAAQFHVPLTPGGFVLTLFLTLPVLVFAFDHMPAISTFVRFYRNSHPLITETHTSKVLFANAGLLTVFVMFFVFSCVLTLTPDQLQSANTQNLPVFSAFSEGQVGSTFTALASVVTFIAIVSSFFGHYMGGFEGIKGLILHFTHHHPHRPSPHHMKRAGRLSSVLIFLSVWAMAYLNVSVITLIEALVAPIVAGILFIMPVVGNWIVPEMKKYRSPWDIFIIVLGTITIFGFVIGNFFF